MEFLNWYAEHWIIGTLFLMFATSAFHGIGRIGSTKVTVKLKTPD